MNVALVRKLPICAHSVLSRPPCETRRFPLKTNICIFFLFKQTGVVVDSSM